MDPVAVGEARERLARWIEDSEGVLGALPALFDEHERLRAAAEAAERECAALRQELAALRAEHGFLLSERSEIAELIADGLNKVMNDALRRLRSPLEARRALEPEPALEPAPALEPEPTYS
jgi:hypothetical protein